MPLPPEKRARLKNLTVLSVAAIFGEAMRCNTLGRSVGELFAFWQEEKQPEPHKPGSDACAVEDSPKENDHCA